MAKKKSRTVRRLPWWGYIVLNLFVLCLFVALYFAAQQDGIANNFPSTGLVPVLVICFLSFVAASVFDALFDRGAEAEQDAAHRKG